MSFMYFRCLQTRAGLLIAGNLSGSCCSFGGVADANLEVVELEGEMVLLSWPKRVGPVIWAATCVCVISLSFFSKAMARSDAEFKHADLRAWVAENAKFIYPYAVPIRSLELEGDDSDFSAIGETSIPEFRVLGLGEGAHGVREFLSLRNRLFAYLVEHHGVTAYASETSFTGAVAIDRYVVNGGELTDEMIDSAYISVPAAFPGTPEFYALGGRAAEVMKRFQEIPAWVRPENRELIEWIREYNARPGTSRPVRFYGVSPCAQSWPDGDGGWTKNGCIGPAIAAALDYMEVVDKPAADALRKRLEVYLPFYIPVDSGSHSDGGPERDGGDRFMVAIDDLIRVFVQRYVLWVGKTSQYDFDMAYRNAIVARQIVNGYRLSEGKVPGDGIVPGLGANDDAGAAQNVLWALDREGHQGRIFLFYHNTHFDKRSTANVGRYLKEVLGNQFYVVAADGSFGVNQVGHVPEAFGIFSALKSPLFFLDLKGLPSRAAKVEGDSGIGDSYDSMFFIKSLHRHQAQ